MRKASLQIAILLLGVGCLFSVGRLGAAEGCLWSGQQSPRPRPAARIVAVSSEARDRNNQVIPQWRAHNLIDGKYVAGTFVPPDSLRAGPRIKPPTPEKPSPSSSPSRAIRRASSAASSSTPRPTIRPTSALGPRRRAAGLDDHRRRPLQEHRPLRRPRRPIKPELRVPARRGAVCPHPHHLQRRLGQVR